mmetsp:Transcript_23660/g.58008  ORF Transcript_23660/g.58008 Transcript_23660/m.58008 type:complete len:398 (-) Transcript_23660:209-1402(-)
MSMKRDRLAAMLDEDLADVRLVGTDGEEVACNKAFLAARSPVFKRMFFKGFREQTEDRCTLNYHSIVIGIVVKYCYSDDELDFDAILEKEQSIDEEAALLIDLRDAGRYLEISRILFEAETKIAELVFEKEKCRCAVAFLNELMNRGEDDGPFWDLLLMFAVDRPIDCFGFGSAENPGKSGTSHPHVNPSVLARVLAYSNDTYTIVRCLQTWAVNENDGGETDDEKSLLNIARNVDLKKLSLLQLSIIGKNPSSLFPMERIFEAFVHHRSFAYKAIRARPKPKNASYHVYGAGMEHVRGSYRMIQEHPPDRQMFEKEGVYRGLPCYFRIHSKASEPSKWRLSVFTRKGSSIVRLCDLYEVRRENGRVPYGKWECVNGVEPPPIVVPSIKLSIQSTRG